MKKVINDVLWLLAIAGFLTLFARPGHAQTVPPDLGGVGKFISDVAATARGGTSVDINKHISAVLYVAYPSIHSQDGKIEYGTLGLGADIGDGVSGTKIHGAPLVLPMINFAALVGLLANVPSIAQHTTFPVLGNINLGVGVKPLPDSGSNGKWIIGNQVEGVATFGFN